MLTWAVTRGARGTPTLFGAEPRRGRTRRLSQRGRGATSRELSTVRQYSRGDFNRFSSLWMEDAALPDPTYPPEATASRLRSFEGLCGGCRGRGRWLSQGCHRSLGATKKVVGTITGNLPTNPNAKRKKKTIERYLGRYMKVNISTDN